MSRWGGFHPIPLWASIGALALLGAASSLGGCSAGAINDPRAFQACTPNCAGKECGDDGCGNSCGTCAQGDLCNARGACYDPNQCTPDCAGKTCGDDACGGSCGTCASDELCDATGACYDPDQCTPSCTIRECGGDGCGGSCGTCPTNEACNGSGACYQPDQCTPDCAGKECGDDGCGSNCGSCASGEACNALGACYDPVQCEPDCNSKECGDDGCGGSCGTCAPDEVCNSQGSCYQPNQCTPNCASRECGDDGCGGSCGTCSGAESCHQISGLCGSGGRVTPTIYWSSTEQTEGDRFNFDFTSCDYPIGTTRNCRDGDSDGVDENRVFTTGSDWSIRQYGYFGTVNQGPHINAIMISTPSWNREINDLYDQKEPVYIYAERYIPHAIDGNGWLALWGQAMQDISDGDRLDTTPGLEFIDAFGGTNGDLPGDNEVAFHFQRLGANDWLSESAFLPTGEWYEEEIMYLRSDSDTANGAIKMWINGTLDIYEENVITYTDDSDTGGPGPYDQYEVIYNMYGEYRSGGDPWPEPDVRWYLRNLQIGTCSGLTDQPCISDGNPGDITPPNNENGAGG